MMDDRGTRELRGRIAFAVQHAYPDARAIRVKKMATSARKAGYEVTIVCPRRNDQTSVDQATEGTVIRLGGTRLSTHLAKPWPLNVWWLARLERLLEERQIDICVVSDLKLALPAILAARRKSIPAILDLGENFAAVTKIWARNDPPWKRYLRSGPHVGWLENTCMRLADRVQVVVEERRQHLTAKLNFSAGKIAVVSNTPDDVLPESAVQDVFQRRFDPHRTSTLRIIYVGIITEDRGLELAVDSVSEINAGAARPAFELLIVGDGRHRPELADKAQQAVARGYCKFLGEVPHESIHDLLLESDIGIIPHWVTEFTNTTIPNKLFDYMNAGLPVIASRMRPVQHIIEEHQCGLIHDRTVHGLVKALRAMLDRAARARMSSNARRAVTTRFNWAHDGKTFLRNLAELLSDDQLAPEPGGSE